jgi:hypothetical protein
MNIAATQFVTCGNARFPTARTRHSDDRFRGVMRTRQERGQQALTIAAVGESCSYGGVYSDEVSS